MTSSSIKQRSHSCSNTWKKISSNTWTTAAISFTSRTFDCSSSNYCAVSTTAIRRRFSIAISSKPVALHSPCPTHANLFRPQNLLINERGELKLADFGLARIKSFPTKTYSHEVVTLWYRPPDVLLGSTEYSTPIDIWAVGCIFYEMACGRPLFAGTKVEEELYLIFKCLGTPTEQSLPGVTSNTDFQALRLPVYHGESMSQLAPRLDQIGNELLEKFLRYDPYARISAHDAMLHRFFSCYPAGIHALGPLQSVLDLNEISLTKDHGSKLMAASLMKTAISKRSSVHL